MSGGNWNYQQYQIERLVEQLDSVVKPLLMAVAETEHIVDWSESADSSREKAEHQLYDLWVKTFNEVYPDW